MSTRFVSSVQNVQRFAIPLRRSSLKVITVHIELVDISWRKVKDIGIYKKYNNHPCYSLYLHPLIQPK